MGYNPSNPPAGIGFPTGDPTKAFGPTGGSAPAAGGGLSHASGGGLQAPGVPGAVDPLAGLGGGLDFLTGGGLQHPGFAFQNPAGFGNGFLSPEAIGNAISRSKFGGGRPFAPVSPYYKEDFISE